MSDRYSPATEPSTIGRKLIKQHHKHLVSRRVDFVFREAFDSEESPRTITSKGRNLYGKAKLVTGLNSFLATDENSDVGPFFVIVISKCFWDTASQEFKHALIDHELCHCEYDSDTDRYSLREHDVAEFTEIVRRHGLWHHDVEVFVKAAKQQSFQFDETKQRGAQLDH
jgi:hypothetical protein